jgi:hypothetical protein
MRDRLSSILRLLSPPRAIALALAAAALAGPALASLPDRRIESNVAGRRLGNDVSAAGDVNGDGYEDLIVGAQQYANGESAEGAFLVFHGGPNGVQVTDAADADTIVESNQANARLGASVASAGDVDGDGYGDVIVGAPSYEDPASSQSNEGGFFVFHGGPGGIPSGPLTGADTSVFGNRVDTRLGEAVSGAGDVNDDGYDDVVAGGWLFSSAVDQSNEGIAVVFLGSATGIPSGGRLDAHAIVESNQAGVYLGDAVAGGGDVNGDGYDDVLVGAPRWTSPESREGAVFVLLGGASGIRSAAGGGACNPACGPEAATARIEADQVGVELGTSVALADVDDDGFDDVVAGAPRWIGGQNLEGAAFVFRGSATAASPTAIDGCAASPCSASAATTKIESNQVGAQLGIAVAGRPLLPRDERADWGGMNDDGIDDVLLGAGFYESSAAQSELNEGAAFLFLGNASGIASGGVDGAARRLEVDRRNAQFPNDADLAFADANGDAYADALAGDVFFSNDFQSQTDEGAVQIFFGGPAQACENTLDDDGDAAADFPLDAGCAGKDDPYEQIDFAGTGSVTITTAQAESVIVRDGTNELPTTLVLGAGGSVAGDLTALGGSAAHLAGGTVSGQLVANDAATAEIAGGSVTGAVVANDSAVVTIRGGSIASIDANDTSRIVLVGTDFDLPLGEVAALSGTITGVLEDATPFSVVFTRDATAAIELPEPGATALGVAALAMLALQRRRS